MLGKLFLTAVALALVVGALMYTKLGQFAAMSEAAVNMVPPPQTVTASTVAEDRWEQVIAATGTVAAVQGVTVSAEVGGRITRIAFESGANVGEGEILLQLDIASEHAQLASAEAGAALAAADLQRVRELGRRDLASEDAVDRAKARVQETVAQVGVISALIDKKTVRAPFTGRLGLRLVNLGQILREGDPIVALQTPDPVHVDFSIPERLIGEVRDGVRVRVRCDAAPGEIFDGEVIALSPEVEAATRNLRVRALVENTSGTLRAGMFANVEAVVEVSRTVLPVPATAVLYAPFGDSVFVVDTAEGEQDGEGTLVLRQQFVRLGEARGDFVEVLDGLKPGETVVNSGVFKLRAGTAVAIDNTLAPKARIDPRPDES